MCAWDIGANVGLFSFAAAFRAGPSGMVLAVEPDIDNVRLLAKSKRNVASVGGYACVDIMPCALAGPGTRAARFAIAQRARASNALAGFGNSQTGGVAETRWVPTLTLDDLLGLFPEPQILKIDVEGAEIDVLKGGARMLRDIRPVLYVEVGSERADGVQVVLRESDYLMFDAAAEEPLEAESPKPQWSTIAAPRERRDDVRRWFELGQP
jgi:FkbM family methyltransferase